MGLQAAPTGVRTGARSSIRGTREAAGSSQRITVPRPLVSPNSASIAAVTS